MKKKILIAIGIVILIVAVLGIVAPREFHIEREITIQKPKEFVFAELKKVKNHGDWMPWEKKDPNIVKEYKGTDGTVGFVASWAGNREVGVGEQEITNIVEGERIDFELRFKEPFEGTDTSYIITETVGDNQTKVKWGFHAHSPFPINILCLVMNMKKMMIQQFDDGLTSMKKHLEAVP